MPQDSRDTEGSPPTGEARISRAELLKAAGGTVALAATGGFPAIVGAAGQAPQDTRIVRAAIFPGMGVARVGNAPGEFFIGPEVPLALTSPGRTYKDAHGRVKRQAARFRIYGLNAAGQVVKEITAADADITWTVHLANKKAAWYRFIAALDLPETLSAPPDRLATRRNPSVKGAQRHGLVIDPGPRTIRGRHTMGPAYHFDTGSFMGKRVPLGELRTDEAGRLLVLGGWGSSATLTGVGPDNTANNDTWHDDTGDGPITATVVLGSRRIPVEPAWVIVGPPKYAPDVMEFVTLYDVVHQAYADGFRHTRQPVSFTRDIYPILLRFNLLQWVNLGFYRLYGWKSQNDFLDPAYLAKLARADPGAAAFRSQVFNRFRPPYDPNRVDASPRYYGDSQFSRLRFESHRFLTVTREQYQNLKDWAAGRFIADWNASFRPARSLEQLPLRAQPAALNRAALDACTGGPFHPGIEAPWILRRASMWAGLCRLRHRSAPEHDYGDVLTPQIALGPDGLLHASGPGEITRWMAVPWQTDTAHCGAAYLDTGKEQPAPDLPTFWPAAAPNQVLTQRAYEQIMQRNLPAGTRANAFANGRKQWTRVLPEDNAGPDLKRNRAVIHDWQKLGFVSARPGPGDPLFPGTMLVETETGF